MTTADLPFASAVRCTRSTEIKHRLHGVESQAVDVKVGDPLASRIEEESPHRFAVATVVVHGLTPRRVITTREVRPEAARVISLGTEMVVDHVEQHAEALLMSRIDELLQPVRTAVGVLHGVWMHAVVAPIARAGELHHGHEFDRRHAELCKLRQSLRGRGEGPFRRERADVQFVNRQIFATQAGPGLVGPRKLFWIEHRRRCMNAGGLPT